jgi:peptidase E
LLLSHSFAFGELLTKHAEARIRKIVVGSNGRKIPIIPIATRRKPEKRYA